EMACLDLSSPLTEAPLQTTGPWEKIVLFAQSHNERQLASPASRAEPVLLSPPTNTGDLALFRRELLLIKAELNKLYGDLRRFRRAFWRHDSDHPLLQPILALATAAKWEQLLAAQTDQERQKEIERIVQANLELFDDFAREVERNLLKPFT